MSCMDCSSVSLLQAKCKRPELTATLPGRVQTELKPKLSKARRNNLAPGPAAQPQQAQQRSQAGASLLHRRSTTTSFHHSVQQEATLGAAPAALVPLPLLPIRHTYKGRCNTIYVDAGQQTCSSPASEVKVMGQCESGARESSLRPAAGGC